MIAAMLDHLWQSTLFLAGAGLLTLVLSGNRAAIRFWVWFAASLKFLFPFALLTTLGAAMASPTEQLPAPAIQAVEAAHAVEQATQPFSPTIAAQPGATGLDFAVILFWIWAAGAVAVLAWWLAGWMRIRAVVRAAAPLALPTAVPVPVKATPARLEPGLVGVFRPVLLVPEGLAETLAPEQVQAVLAHELCHLRRRDNLTAAMHMLVQALFWFYPPVWWIGARLIAERERACDEAVVQAGHDPEAYARSILDTCRAYLRSPLACVAGVSGANLKKRVEAIMTKSTPSPIGAAKMALLVVSTWATFVLPLAAGSFGASFADAQTQDQAAKLKAEQEAPQTQIPFDPKHFDKYVAHYQLRPEAVFTVTRDGDKFLAQLSGQPALRVYPESETKFFYTAVPAQISFTVDPQGKVSELVLHQNGVEMHAKRVDDATAKAAEAALAERIKNKVPSPGLETFLRRYIASQEAGKPDYSEMTPGLALAAREQQAMFAKNFVTWGPLVSITFSRVTPGGLDSYLLTFKNVRVPTVVAPIGADGKVGGLLFQQPF